jgi:hypothetical protein
MAMVINSLSLTHSNRKVLIFFKYILIMYCSMPCNVFIYPPLLSDIKCVLNCLLIPGGLVPVPCVVILARPRNPKRIISGRLNCECCIVDRQFQSCWLRYVTRVTSKSPNENVGSTVITQTFSLSVQNLARSLT